MKRSFPLVLIILMLFSCAPVLRKDLMQQGMINFELSDIRQDPADFKGRLFILGGIIVRTSLTKEGSLIEAIHVPVNSRGYLKNTDKFNGRFLAIYRGKILDPAVFREKREITLAGELIDIRRGMIDEIEYVYPYFDIREIYLWEETPPEMYYRYPYDPYYSPYPYFWYRHHIPRHRDD